MTNISGLARLVRRFQGSNHECEAPGSLDSLDSDGRSLRGYTFSPGSRVWALWQGFVHVLAFRGARCRIVSSTGGVWVGTNTFPTARSQRTKGNGRCAGNRLESHGLRQECRCPSSLCIMKMFREFGLPVSSCPTISAASALTQDLRELGIEVIHGNVDVRRYLKQRASSFDFCFINYADLAQSYVPYLRKVAAKLPIIYDTVDLHFVREKRRAAFDGNDHRAEYDRNLEVKLASMSEAVITVTERERAVFAKEVTDVPIHVIPTVHEQLRRLRRLGSVPAFCSSGVSLTRQMATRSHIL